MSKDSELLKDKCWLFHTDCVAYLNKRNRGLIPIRLCVADPPYNYDQDYADYPDRLKQAEFYKWTQTWLRAVHAQLASNASLFVFAPDEWVSDTDVFCRHELGLTRRNWIVWAFTFGQKATKSFTRSHCHILYYVKDPSNFTFNTAAVAVQSARQLVYKDKRAAGPKPPDDVWMLLKEQLEPCMTFDKSVWLESRICGSFKERQPHSPNQLPLALVERIILACSSEGDLILDPFLGTGTTGVAALKNKRRFVGFDISKECVDKSRTRIITELGV